MNRSIMIFIGILVMTSFTLAATTGSISGKVTGVPAPHAMPGAFAQPPAPSVVYAILTGEHPAAPAQTVIVDQQWGAFNPQVAAVAVGGTVEFRNNDTVKHNVKWDAIGEDKALAHDLGSWQPGQTVRYTFTHAGAIHLECALHPHMSGWIMVVPTPYYAVTSPNGTFTITHLPSGKYRLVAWHAHLPSKSQAVAVEGNSVNVTVKF